MRRAPVADARVVETLDAVDPAAWDACYPGTPEGHAYLHAVEHANITGFAFRYALVEEAGLLLAAAPLFVTRYPLETTFDGSGPWLVERLRGVFPAFLAPRLACIGSPCTETATIGFLPGLTETRRATLARRLLNVLEELAQVEGASLLGIKDVAAVDRPMWGALAAQSGFTEMSGLPTASLPIEFPDMDAYLSQLSAGTRRDMRRKLRPAAAVRIEVRHHLGDVIEPVMALYRQTLVRAELRFETLTAAYFEGVLRAMPDRAFACLYWVDDELLAFNLLLDDGNTLLDKYFCMDGTKGRRHSLYFLSWFTNVGYCLEHKLTRYVAGQAGYESKVRLGCVCDATTMYFRHRKPLVNRALQMAAPMLAPDQQSVA